MSTTVQFDTQHLYYLPQYLPVAKELLKLGITCQFIVYRENEIDEVKQAAIEEAGFEAIFLASPEKSLAFYKQSKADWIIFGNKPGFSASEVSCIQPKLALMQHGIGPKACYYDVSEFPFNVRFVEGQKRLTRLQERFPLQQFVDTGYAKLDPLFQESAPLLSIAQLGLDAEKPTLLYAPTFFPSSIEHFSADWPATLSDYNIIVKPHFFSQTKRKYHAHRKLFASWQSYKNVYLTNVEEYNLLPFMQVADIMLSDASSAIFEFSALSKPVVWCDFYSMRWSYRGLLSFRFRRRIDPDIALFHQLTTRANSAKKVSQAVAQCTQASPRQEKARQRILEDMVGRTDGCCSHRIAKYLFPYPASGDNSA